MGRESKIEGELKERRLIKVYKERKILMRKNERDRQRETDRDRDNEQKGSAGKRQNIRVRERDGRERE